MIHHEARVECSMSDGVDLFFWGDEQEGAEGFRGDAWAAFKDDWKRSKNPYAIGMGDYRDWLRPSMRAKLEAVMTSDKSMKSQLDSLVMRGLEETGRRLEFMKGRILGLHEGHHDYEFMGGANATMLLAIGLKTMNLGWIASTRLVLEPSQRKTTRTKISYTFTIVSTHGNAGGRDTTSVARGMEASMKDYVCDLKVMGHACRSANWTPHMFKMIKRSGAPGVVSVIPRHLLVGGFCDAYTDGWTSVPITESGKKIGGRPKSTYAQSRNMISQPLMWGVARIRFRVNSAIAKSRSMHPDAKLIDIEVVNRGPSIDENGLYR